MQATETKVKELPILMHARSIRGILEGRKTQTRRIVKPQPLHIEWFAHQNGWCGRFRDDGGTAGDPAYRMVKCPYGVPGDRLWVRETWRYDDNPKAYRGIPLDDRRRVIYSGSENWDEVERLVPADNSLRRKRPSIHMPRWACRLVLEVTGVRVERLHDITAKDIMAEGVTTEQRNHQARWFSQPWHMAFRELWDDTNGDGAWDRNDWVWVVEFNQFRRE